MYQYVRISIARVHNPYLRVQLRARSAGLEVALEAAVVAVVRRVADAQVVHAARRLELDPMGGKRNLNFLGFAHHFCIRQFYTATLKCDKCYIFTPSRHLTVTNSSHYIFNKTF